MATLNNRQSGLKISSEKIICIFTAIYFFISFFEGYLNQVIGSLVKFFIFALALLYIWKYKGKITLNFISVSYIVWFAYKLLTLLWTRSYYMFDLHIFAHIGIVLIVTCIVSKPLSNKTIHYLTGALWLGSFSIGLLSLFFHTAYLGTFTARQVLVLFGVSEDPNNQASFLLFGIAIALYYIVLEKRYIAFGLITIFVNIASLMMTSSRGGFITVVLMALIIIFMTDKKSTKIWAVIVVIMASVLIYKYAGNFVSVDSWDRLMVMEGYEGGSGRIDRWENTIRLLNENPLYYLFGAGWGANWGYNGFETGIHNTYLSHLCDTGIIGLIIFHYPIIKCAIYFWRRQQYLPIIVLLCGLLPSVFLDSINKRYFWNSLLYLFICYMNKKAEDETTVRSWTVNPEYFQ